MTIYCRLRRWGWALERRSGRRRSHISWVTSDRRRGFSGLKGWTRWRWGWWTGVRRWGRRWVWYASSLKLRRRRRSVSCVERRRLWIIWRRSRRSQWWSVLVRSWCWGSWFTLVTLVQRVVPRWGRCYIIKFWTCGWHLHWLRSLRDTAFFFFVIFRYSLRRFTLCIILPLWPS